MCMAGLRNGTAFILETKPALNPENISPNLFILEYNKTSVSNLPIPIHIKSQTKCSFGAICTKGLQNIKDLLGGRLGLPTGKQT